MATPEDHALRAALVGFNIGLFGDHRSILRRQPDTTVKVDHDYFMRCGDLPWFGGVGVWCPRVGVDYGAQENDMNTHI